MEMTSSAPAPNHDSLRRGADCVVVGGGPSGLACAVTLARAGLTVQVFEASASAGGRARGGMHQGEPVDVGFQTILRAYPTAIQFLGDIGIGSGELRTFQRRMVIHDGTKWRRLRLAGPGSLATSGLIPRADLTRLLRLGARAAVGGARELDGGHAETALEMFQAAGVSQPTIDRVLRPLLGSMLLDHTLESDAGYVRFLLGMLSRGPACLPVDGMAMLADRAVTALTSAGGMLWTGTPVAAITREAGGPATGVRLADGRTVGASTVVIASGVRATRSLLADVDPASAERLPSELAGAVSASFALERPLYDEATILLDAAGPAGTDRVDIVCQTTNVTRPGSPGPHVLVAQSATAGWRDVDPQRYADAVRRRMVALIPGFDWAGAATLIDATVHPDALYRVTPGVRAALPGPRTALANLMLAGDVTTHPSLEGAISAGLRAADLVAELLR